MTATVDLLAAIDERERQVRQLRAAYAAAMARDGATYWIAEAARELRLANHRLMVDVAVRLRASEPKISRFERHKSIPDDLDDVVTAYATELEVEPVAIWRRALEMWEAAATDAAESQDGVPGVAGVADRLAATVSSPQVPARGQAASPSSARQRKRA